MTDRAKGAEEVAILLGEDEHFLRPTLRAAKAVNRRFGGFIAAFERVAAWDFSAIVDIVAAGLDKREPADLKAIEQSVYDAGLQPLIAPVSRFVEMLASGGQSPVDDGEADPAKKDVASPSTMPGSSASARAGSDGPRRKRSTPR